MTNYPTIYIRAGREKSIQRFHPWVFSGSVLRVEGQPEEGDLVRLLDARGGFLGLGHYNKGSIAVKVLSFAEEEINEAWYRRRLERAAHLRKSIGMPHPDTNAYRLVHGEGDGLPGLIADIYGDVAVLQPHSRGMELACVQLARAVVDLGLAANVVLKPLAREAPRVLNGNVQERTAILENGMRFHVDVLAGQKTGFFLDQRDNRHLLRSYAAGKRVLNVFSYTGGFSVAALAGGALEAISLDSSTQALALAEENATLNEAAGKHRSLKADAVPYLENMHETYDVIVLDPPAFAKHMSARHNAIQAYRRINEAAMKNLVPGGLLFTFSCSQVVDRQLFQDTLVSAALNAGKKVKVLHHLRQPADHPVSIFHPEGEYLKGLVLEVE